MKEFDRIICHCASKDCSNCPMRNTGTSGVKAEWNFFHHNNNNIGIYVHKNCCAGTSKDAHNDAITAMKSCQIEII